MSEDAHKDIEEFKSDTLERLAKILDGYKEYLKQNHINRFNHVVKTLINQAIIRFKTLYPEHKEFEDTSVHIHLISTIIEKLNGKLPLNYPYIIVILDIKDELPRLHLATLSRNLIPALYDSLHTDMVPICLIQTRSDLTDPNFRLSKVYFSN